MTLPEMLADLPRHCDIGVKRDAKGYQRSWNGYKFHLDVADGAIPVSCLLTSASLHDSQGAIPLATLTAGRLRNLYDLMDSAYDAPQIRAHSRALGHVPIIDTTPGAACASRHCSRRGGHAMPVGWSCLRRDVTTNARTSNVSMVASRACPELDSGMNSGGAACVCVAMPKACPQLDWGCCVI